MGRRVVPRLEAAGYEAIVATRTPTAPGHRLLDLTTGEGLAEALDGARTVIHLATDNFNTAGVDTAGTERLLSAIDDLSVHLVYVSIVGIDGHTFPYYRAKRGVEDLIEASPVLWTILRATQFHDLIRRFVDPLAKLPIVPAPSSTPIQPIDPDVVADRVVKLTASSVSGRVPDMGGPEVLDAVDMVKRYLRATNRRRLVIPVRFPGKAAAQFRDGSILTPNKITTGRTWEQWLSELTLE